MFSYIGERASQWQHLSRALLQHSTVHSYLCVRVPDAGRQGRASILKMKEVSRHKILDVLSGYGRYAQALTNHTGEDFA